MADLGGFDANEWEPNGSFEAIPEGWYPVVITESDMVDTKAGDGRYLKLKLQIIDGPFSGRTLFDQLNLENPNETAVKIAKGSLSAICRAVGRMTVRQSEELHNLPLQARVIQEEYRGEMKNKVKGYKAAAEAAPAPAQSARTAAPAQAPQPAAAGKGGASFGGQGGPGRKKAPWEK